MQVIIYKQHSGRLSIVCPTPEAVAMFSIEAVALKDVPAGKPFKIIDDSELPADRSQRDAWTVDDAELTDGVGADYGNGSDWDVLEIGVDGLPLLLRNRITGELRGGGK